MDDDTDDDMSVSPDQFTPTIALIGNPNTGKSTLFSALAGVRQRIGNYPGVTVEKKTGPLKCEGRQYELVDLPGIYSLAPRSKDEMVSVDVLLGRRNDLAPVAAVVCIVDASNSERNFYLLSQLLELGLPTVLAMNMLDVAEAHDITVDVEQLREKLDIPVVAMQANRGIGIAELRVALAEVIARPPRPDVTPLPDEFEREASQFESLLTERASGGDGAGQLPRYLIRRLLLDVNGYLQSSLLPKSDKEARQALAESRRRLARVGCRIPAVETTARYAWVRGVLEGAVRHPTHYKTTTTDRIDRVLTHRVWGSIVFAVVMVVLFQSVFAWAGPLMELIDAGTKAAGGVVETWITAAGLGGGALESLLVEGVIGGVGGVLAFLPQIMVLFLFIALLEDCGYMARAACLMDKLMVRVGLSGKSFIPMLASFACAIPGIMAARVIENRRDRLTTILVAPLMTCSARLPIYALLIAAFIPAKTYFGIFGLQGLTLAALYVLGIGSAVIAALVFKKTILRGSTPPFVMELPTYKWPSLRAILFRVAERATVFLRTAGTMILAVSITVWAALYYPHNSELAESRPEIRQLRAELAALSPNDPRHETISADLDRQLSGAYQRQSLLASAGRFVEPVFRPLGWDWRVSCAIIASFPAREVVVATLGVIYNLGEDVDSESREGVTQFRAKLDKATWDGSDRKVFTVPVALSIMVFFALCGQCAATMAVIRRETNSWRWPAFTFSYMTVLAYFGAMITYQVGTWIGG